MENIRQRILNCLLEVFEIDRAPLGDDASPETIEDWDSLSHINLVLSLETEFQIKFAMDEVPKLISMKEIQRMVEQKIVS